MSTREGYAYQSDKLYHRQHRDVLVVPAHSTDGRIIAEPFSHSSASSTAQVDAK